MEATIEIKESEYDDYKIESYKTFFGWKERRIDRGKKKQFHVYLTLTPSEEERAIILKYDLQELCVEEIPKFSRRVLADMEESWADALKREYSESGEQMAADAMKEARAEKEQVIVERYFDNPYIRTFDVRQDAHTYADKIQEEILPTIKKQIDYYRVESVLRDKRTITL